MNFEKTEIIANLSDRLFGTGGDADHEMVTLRRDPVSGLKAIIAVHSTARGPAFGGCRYWHYASDTAALHDALRLSQGMSLKNALADLPFGGGKAVLLKGLEPADRHAFFQAFGRAVESLNGAYITAEDVGTTVADMRAVQSQTHYVSGVMGEQAFGGDPSPKTALGVFVSIQVAVAKLLGRASLEGVTVAVQGLGSVGWRLCKLLRDAGAILSVSDLDSARIERARQQFAAQAVAPAEILSQHVDVLAPCALGGALNDQTVGTVRARIIAGAANNQLSHAGIDGALHARGIFYAPDFLVNAGGIISVAREWLGQGDQASVVGEVLRIGDRLAELIDRIHGGSTAPAREAENWARTKLVAASRG
jgi:leucine dehydrogenase